MKHFKNISMIIMVVILIIGTGATKEEPPIPDFIKVNKWIKVNTSDGHYRCAKGFVRLPREQRDSIFNSIEL